MCLHLGLIPDVWDQKWQLNHCALLHWQVLEFFSFDVEEIFLKSGPSQPRRGWSRPKDFFSTDLLISLAIFTFVEKILMWFTGNTKKARTFQGVYLVKEPSLEQWLGLWLLKHRLIFLASAFQSVIVWCALWLFRKHCFLYYYFLANAPVSILLILLLIFHSCYSLKVVSPERKSVCLKKL